MAGSDARSEHEWIASALTTISDLMVVLDDQACIVWANESAGKLLGRSVEDAIGRSIADFVHPDDLARAAEVMFLVGEGRFETDPVTPALYRVLTGTGDWMPLEINSSSVPGPGGEMVIIGRFAGDLVYSDALLEAVIAGESISKQVQVVIELGRWRYPREGYAVIAHERRDLGSRSVDRQINELGPGLPPRLGGVGCEGLATPWQAAIASGETMTVQDLSSPTVNADVIAPELVAEAIASGYSGCTAVPVVDPGHPLSACIVVWSTFGGPSLAGHRYAIDNMRRALGLVLQERAQVARLERAAHIDGLTGVLSRSRFLELLRWADGTEDPNRRHAVLFVDLDRFKQVNDQHGHGVGDQVLAESGRRLRTALPDGAIAGRLGGDEFAVLCPPDAADQTVDELAAAVVAALSAPLALAQDQVIIGASVGVAIGGPSEPAERVLDRADRALGDAKASGRGHWKRSSVVPASD